MSTPDDLAIRRCTLKDIPAISKLLEKVSLPGDPEFRLMVGSGIVPLQEMIDFVVATHTHTSVILHPCSLVATTKSSNSSCDESSKVVAFRLSAEAHPSKVDEDPIIQNIIDKSPGLQRRARVFEDMNRGTGIDAIALPPGTKGVLEFLQLTVDPNYRQQGLATKLVQEAIAIAKSLPGCHFINVYAASRYTGRIFQTQGFRKVSQLDYRTYQQRDDGKPFFNSDLIDEHDSMELYRLDLQKDHSEAKVTSLAMKDWLQLSSL